MKNQFVNRPSQEGSIDQQKASPGTTIRHNKNDQQEAGEIPAKSGLVTKWKTGQLHHPAEATRMAQTGSLTDDNTSIDPLSKRQMPKRQSPATNPFSTHADEIPTIQQPVMPAILRTLQPSRITRDLNGWGQRPDTGQLGSPTINNTSSGSGQYNHPGPINTQRFNAGQTGPPNSSSGSIPPGFVQAPAATGFTRAHAGRHVPIWARAVIGVLAFFIIAGGGAFAYYQFTFAGSVNSITGQDAIHDNKSKFAPEPANIDPLTQRTNIVLLGSDTDGKNNDPDHGQPLAQTVIVITVDPKTNQVGMLSIPRDMQVTDSVYDGMFPNSKIDQAFEHAWQGKNAQDKARRAAGHMMDIIEANYGIHVDHYAWVGLQGFIKVIDTIGGVDVDISHPMFDDLYPDDTGNSKDKYDYKRLSIAPGPQHLTGLQALEYVRTRHADLGGDFGRTDRQQQVLGQVKVKLTNADTITKAPALLNDLNGFLMTDLSLNQLYTFAQIAKGIDINKLNRVSLTNNYTTPIKTNPYNNYAPNCQVIVPKIREMFGVANPTCLSQGSIQNNVGTNVARTQPDMLNRANTSHFTDQQAATNSMKVSRTVTRVSDTSTLNNLLDLMLLTTSGSFTAMQN